MNKAKNILSTVRQKINYANNDIGSMLGLNKPLFEKARGARIVLYHGICMNDPTRFNNIFLSLNTFREHLAFYKKHFHVISLDDFYLQRFHDDRFNICIAFDDGYANNYNYVLPLLKEYQLPATFFITAIRDAGYDILWNDFLGIISKYGPATLMFKDELFRKKSFNRYISSKDNTGLKEMLRAGGFDIKDEMMKALYELAPFRENKSGEDYWLQMTAEQIMELSASEWATVGCHGYYHNDLAAIDIDEVEKEMFQSKNYLEKLTRKEIKAIAFPYGTYTPSVIHAAKKTGFTQLLALDFLFDENHRDPMMRERFTVNPFISVNNQMIANIKGTYASSH